MPISPEPKPNSGKRWCLPKPEANDENLQKNIDYVCGLGIDCAPIKEGGACFYPNTVRDHAAYAMNAYYQTTAKNGYDCDFAQTAATTISNPSIALHLCHYHNMIIHSFYSQMIVNK